MAGLARACYGINCTADGEVCQLNIGKSCKSIVHVARTVLGRDAVISAALAVTALTFSALFDLEDSYSMVAGVAGINPKVGPLKSGKVRSPVGLEIRT